ncbi:unnamed protein product [Polarella glacialis]|uniref:WW domain-containing protein n=1 Tax=Polarella glacialis TaxID=89957 RepID=A0A813HD79_POLGL|nr:unnamed protein product [Polarella glacialis]
MALVSGFRAAASLSLRTSSSASICWRTSRLAPLCTLSAATAGLGRVAEESISDDRWPRTRADSRERLGLQIANQERSSRRHQDAGLSSAVSSEGLGVKGEVLDAARNRDWAAARAAFDRLEKPERVVYNSLLHAADRCNRRREAEIIFSEMQEKSIVRSEIAYTSVINLCARDGDTDRVFELLKQLRSEGLQPDVMVYSAALAGYSRTFDVEGAAARWKEMLEGGVRPTSIAFISLLNVYAASRDPVSARVRLAEMASFGLVPQTPHWNVLLKACLRKPDAEGALAALGEMRAAGVSPNVVSFTTALAAIHAQQLPGSQARAEALCHEMSALGVQADSFFVEERVRGQLGELQYQGSRGRRASMETLGLGTLESAAETLRKAREVGIRVGPRTLQLETELADVLAFRGRASSGAATAAASPSVSSVPSSPSAADWVEVRSAEHGIYFWDRSTGTTQWTRPAGLSASDTISAA